MTRTAAVPARGPVAPRRPVPWWAAPVGIFAASRVVTTLLFVWVQSQATVASRAGAHPSLLDLASAWDGQWYWLIGVQGYPSVLPLTPAGTVDTNQWAFLPFYPMLVQALTLGLLDWRAVALAVSIAAGFGAAVLLLMLLQPRIGRGRGLFAVAVFSCSPLSFVLQTTYAESLGLLLLLAALVLVDRGRFGAAIPVAVLLAFTRPGVLALALAVVLHLAARLVKARRGGPPLPRGELLRGALLAVVAAAAGFAWSGVAALVTGRPDAYFATEGAWRALWMVGPEIVPFQPWFFAAGFWTQLAVGTAAARWLAPVVLAVVVGGFAVLLLLPPVRRLGGLVRAWSAAYALYLLAVFFPQSSVFRLLMPLAPLAGALVPARPAARAGVLLVSLVLQATWLWVTYGPIQTYWSVP